MKRVAFFIPDLGGGGAEKTVVNLLRGMPEKEYILDLILVKAKGVFLRDVPSYVRIVDLGGEQSIRSFLPLSGYLRRYQPDVFISHLSHANIIVLYANRIFSKRTKWILVEHALITPDRLRSKKERLVLWLMKKLYPRQQNLVAVSEGVAAELEKNIAALGIGGDTSLPGFVENPYAYMARCDAFVLASQWKALPGAPIEAMACGCPVIATDCLGGVSEILGDGEYGMMVPVGDVNAMASAMMKMVDPERPVPDREKLRRRVADFSVEKALDAYRSLIGGSCVVHIISGLKQGGAVWMLCNLVLKMKDRNNLMGQKIHHEVVSLSGSDDGKSVIGRKLMDSGIPVHFLGMKPGRLPSVTTMKGLIGLLRLIRPQLIQGWMYHGNLAASFARPWVSGKPPVVWGIHHSVGEVGAGQLQREKPLTRLIIRLGAKLSVLADRIVYVSGVSRRQHVALGYRDTRGVTIPNGVDTDRFTPVAEARAWLLGTRVEAEVGGGEAGEAKIAEAELGEAEGGRAGAGETGAGETSEEGRGSGERGLLIGHVARYDPLKDHANFLRAAALVSKSCPEACFVLAGSGIDKGNRELTGLVSELGIADRVYWLGARNDIEKVLAGLDIFCLSSYSEALPLVLLEAMACGIPCVTTDTGDAAVVVGETGLSVAARDPEALAAAMQTLADAGREQRAKLGEAARERVKNYYSLETVANKYNTLYASLLDGDATDARRADASAVKSTDEKDEHK